MHKLVGGLKKNEESHRASRLISHKNTPERQGDREDKRRQFLRYQHQTVVIRKNKNSSLPGPGIVCTTYSALRQVTGSTTCLLIFYFHQGK